MPSMYYSAADITTLKALKTAASHSAMWDTIEAWCIDHVNDSPPEEPSPNTRALSQAFCDFIDKMVFMYHMTDDTDYADAACTWMLYVAENWTAWNIANDVDHNTFRMMGFGFANGYYSLRDYFTEADRSTIADNIVANVLPVYARYDGYVPASTYSPGFYSSYTGIGGLVGIAGLALGADYIDGDTWLQFGKDWMEYAVGSGGTTDGGWKQGPNYGTRSGSFDRMFRFLQAVLTVDTTDYFDTYSGFLSNVPYFFLYLTIEDDHAAGTTFVQIEDATGGYDYFSETDHALSYSYKSASIASDGYAQAIGNTYANQGSMFSYIWKDPDLTALTLSNLPLYRNFEGIGYVTWRTGWDTDDLLFLFKSGMSMGHCHPNQNTFIIYKNGRPITCPPGYATGSGIIYKTTWPSNCITTGADEGTDEQIYGFGQAHEPNSIGGCTVALGTTGTITEAVLDNQYYKYVCGDASVMYNNDVYPVSNVWPIFSSGDLDKFVRHVVFIPDQEYFVIYDDVVSSGAARKNWWYNALDIYNEEGSGDPPSLTIADDLITNTIPGDYARRVEIKVLQPSTYTSDIRSAAGVYAREFSYILLWPTTDVASTRFLMVMTADDKISEGTITIAAVSQNNCDGVIVSYGTKKDLIMFSNDGAAVDEYIEIGGTYHADDGGTYTYSGTTVRVQIA